jgi:hypothetical protein
MGTVPWIERVPSCALPPPPPRMVQLALLDGPSTVLTLRAEADVDVSNRSLVRLPQRSHGETHICYASFSRPSRA